MLPTNSDYSPTEWCRTVAWLWNILSTFKENIFLVFHYVNIIFPKSSNMVTFNFNSGNVPGTFSNWLDIGNALQLFRL